MFYFYNTYFFMFIVNSYRLRIGSVRWYRMVLGIQRKVHAGLVIPHSIRDKHRVMVGKREVHVGRSVIPYIICDK